MDQVESDESCTSVRTIWISDTHLGFPGANAAALLDFLHGVRCEHLYLVGDIIDFWALRRRRHWPQTCNNLIRTVLGMAKHGTRVVYLPGNHDDAIRQYDGLTLGNIAIHEKLVHETADGRRLLVLHGDQFDSVVVSSRLVGLVGSRAYAGLLNLNRLVNWGRARLGMEYWSLAAAAKQKVKKAASYVANFERAIAYEARHQQVDGLVCGHIHRAELTWMDGVLYVNCGDWVESTTALVEHHDGTLELWQLGECPAVLRRLAPRDTATAA
ncbi:MAG: UDP-2,3-diacylglucosamine diphosphatase [Halofilum sp. (in: g-proteobacteria)]|nr:UDP-2,3-diacylglucosamine diphosphatase [Halofilum sp. (in: g-proteobacteria)]